LDGRIKSGEPEICLVRKLWLTQRLKRGVSRRKMPDQSGQNINKWWWANFVQSLRPSRETSKRNFVQLFPGFDPMKEL